MCIFIGILVEKSSVTEIGMKAKSSGSSRWRNSMVVVISGDCLCFIFLGVLVINVWLCIDILLF